VVSVPEETLWKYQTKTRTAKAFVSETLPLILAVFVEETAPLEIAVTVHEALGTGRLTVVSAEARVTVKMEVPNVFEEIGLVNILDAKKIYVTSDG
jgi:hypothetical protein